MSIIEAPQAIERLDFGSAGVRMTPAEFDAVEEFDEQYCYELIQGVVVVSPIPLEGEAGPNELLGHLLWHYQAMHEQGEALDESFGERYVHSGEQRRRADRVIWAGLGRRPNPGDDVPAIVVEFVSHSKRDHRRDYVEKRAEYLALGVQEYWVFNRFARTTTVFQVDDPEERVFQNTETYSTPLLPGFELPLAKLQAAADRWDTE